MQIPAGGEIRREWGVWLQYSGAEAAVHPEMRELHRELYGRWTEAVARTIERPAPGRAPRGPAGEMARALTALVDGAATQVMTGVEGADAEEMRALLLAYVDERLAVAARR